MFPHTGFAPDQRVTVAGAVGTPPYITFVSSYITERPSVVTFRYGLLLKSGLGFCEILFSEMVSTDNVDREAFQ